MKNKSKSQGVALLALTLTGCFRGDSTRLYLLDAGENAPPVAAATALDGASIGLGPIRIAEYLDRPQLVVAVSPHQYRLEDKNRWAESLNQNISRSLAQALSRRLPNAQIVRHPWAARQAPDYQLSLEIDQLHQSSDGYSRLQAQWRIAKAGKTLVDRRFDCEQAAAADDAEAIVAAQSRCLAALTETLVQALRAH